ISSQAARGRVVLTAAILFGFGGACASGGTGATTGSGGSGEPASGGTGGSARGGATGSGGISTGTGGTGTGTGGIVATGGASGRGGASGAAGGSGRGGSAGAGEATGGHGGNNATTGTGGAAGSKGGAAGGGGTAAGGTAGARASGGTTGAGGASDILGATPPMGWNSWNLFQCNINEKLIQGIADAMVSSGMQAVGYQYVNLDDCWMNGRDSSGKLQYNTTKFPSGIAALASYIHGKGLKFGIYESPNTKTCVGLYCNCSDAAGAVGSGGHETTDAQTFASWGVDYLKYDHCAASGLGGFATMGNALRATGRPIFFSINPGDGSGCPPNTCSINLPSIANMWRIGFDINASWSSMIGLVDQDANLSQYAGPGHWNDPDMLEVGNSGLSDAEGRTHFSMWAILAAPLIAGNDIRSMSANTKATLTNSEVVAVDQDPLGMQGKRVATPGTNLEVWSKTLAGTNTRAVALLNRGTSAASITVQWSQIGLPAGAATVRDLWSHTDLGSFTGSYMASSVPSHGVVMLKVTSSP
ncbi:MAG TPA: glycoside hydrolase family 27 protein, partial [Polyangia bacterium]|nr:glycoside hydrolase family 27 protein [Polyangia bacterium]